VPQPPRAAQSAPRPPLRKNSHLSLFDVFFGPFLKRILPRQPAPPSEKFDLKLAPGGHGLAGQPENASPSLIICWSPRACADTHARRRGASPSPLQPIPIPAFSTPHLGPSSRPSAPAPGRFSCYFTVTDSGPFVTPARGSASSLFVRPPGLPSPKPILTVPRAGVSTKDKDKRQRKKTETRSLGPLSVLRSPLVPWSLGPFLLSAFPISAFPKSVARGLLINIWHNLRYFHSAARNGLKDGSGGRVNWEKSSTPPDPAQGALHQMQGGATYDRDRPNPTRRPRPHP
jgi:hypothetical protein